MSTTVRRKAVLAVLLSSAAAVTSSCRSDEPDLVLYNGKIVTLNASDEIVEGVAIRDGRFVAVGSSADVRALAGASTEQMDLDGQTVIPGLSDNHYHSIGGGPGVDLSRARSLDEVLSAIGQRVAETPNGEVVVTNRDWHEGQLREQRLPYRDDLDRVAPQHAVVAVRGGHEYILNSVALDRWNIDEQTPSPEGGRIGRYASGRLNGELVDRAKDLVELPSRPEPDQEALIEALVAEHKTLHAVGLTSIRHPGASAAQYAALREMHRRGLLNIRVNLLFRFGGADTSQLDSVIDSWGASSDEDDEWLRIGGVKLGVDGGFEGGWMREPYVEPWGQQGTFYGLQTIPTERYTQVVLGFQERGWRIATHAVGDAAIDLVLAGYEAANERTSIAGRRWVIEHGFIPQSDQFPRMRAMELVVSAQNHLYVAGPSLVEYWGQERADWTTPVRAYLDAGIPVSAGTDSPVIPYNPFWTLYHFITRETISAGVMGADQRVTRMEALRLSTLANAYLTFEEDRKGSIEVGKYADLVLLSDDILTCEEAQIENLQAELTIAGGRVVYRQ